MISGNIGSAYAEAIRLYRNWRYRQYGTKITGTTKENQIIISEFFISYYQKNP